jgi:predicted nucleotidyltransferase
LYAFSDFLYVIRVSKIFLCICMREVASVINSVGLGMAKPTLVGSYSRGEPYSDIDVTVKLAPRKLKEFIGRLTNYLNNLPEGLYFVEAKAGYNYPNLYDEAQRLNNKNLYTPEDLERWNVVNTYTSPIVRDVRYVPSLFLQPVDRIIAQGVKVDFYLETLGVPLTVLYQFKEEKLNKKYLKNDIRRLILKGKNLKAVKRWRTLNRTNSRVIRGTQSAIDKESEEEAYNIVQELRRMLFKE